MSDDTVTVSEVGHNANAPDRFLMVGERRLALFKTRRAGQAYSYEIYALTGGAMLARSPNFDAAVAAGVQLMAEGILVPEVLPESAKITWWIVALFTIWAWLKVVWCNLAHWQGVDDYPDGRPGRRCRTCGREWLI